MGEEDRTKNGNSGDGQGNGDGEGRQTGTSTGQEGGSGGQDRLLTQEEVNQIVAQRAERIARQKYGDYDALKQKAEQWDQHQEGQKSEQEKLQAELARQQDENARLVAERNDQLIRASIMKQALAKGVRPEAVDDVYRLADLANLTIEEDGGVAGVTEVVDTVLTNRQYLLASAPLGSIGAGQGSGQRGAGQFRLSADEQTMAEVMGLSVEDYADGKEKRPSTKKE